MWYTVIESNSVYQRVQQARSQNVMLTLLVPESHLSLPLQLLFIHDREIVTFVALRCYVTLLHYIAKLPCNLLTLLYYYRVTL